MKTYKVYLAATFARKEEMRGYRSCLKDIGIEVTSRWIDVERSDSLGHKELAIDPSLGFKYARVDLEDIAKANWMILFGESGPSSSVGGHNVELGYAIALNVPVHLVGAMENVFYSYFVYRHDTFGVYFDNLKSWIANGWRPER